VLTKVREVCQTYLNPGELLPVAEKAVTEAQKQRNRESEAMALQSRIDSLTVNLDKMYMDKLSGLLSEPDFERIYQKVKAERTALEEKLKAIEKPACPPKREEDLARELVRRFIDTAETNRELLVSLIERVELTEDKQIIIKFRFRALEHLF
jgi:hypothetical protein